MRKIAMGLALASTALASPALAKEGQWYIGVDAGAMIVDSASADGTDISVDHDEGYDFGAVVGHDFGAFRLETRSANPAYAEAEEAFAGYDPLRGDVGGARTGRGPGFDASTGRFPVGWNQ